MMPCMVPCRGFNGSIGRNAAGRVPGQCAGAGLDVFFFAVALWFKPLEAIFLWFLPVCMMAWLIAAVFMYWPHVPHEVKHADNPWRATLNRRGCNGVLSLLLANQNWHLVHQLYPNVPFYRYQPIWNARRRYHESHNPATVRFRVTHGPAGPLLTLRRLLSGQSCHALGPRVSLR